MDIIAIVTGYWTEYKLPISIAFGWFVHVNLPWLRKVYPYYKENYGIIGNSWYILRNFLLGDPATHPKVNPQTPLN